MYMVEYGKKKKYQYHTRHKENAIRLIDKCILEDTPYKFYRDGELVLDSRKGGVVK